MKKIKIVVIILIVILLCIFIVFYIGLKGGFTKTKYYFDTPELNYYHGVIVDSYKKPVQSAKVSIWEYPDISTETNNHGYFILKNKKINVANPNRIKVKKTLNTLETYTIPTISILDHRNKTIEQYDFSKKNPDTIVLETPDIISN